MPPLDPPALLRLTGAERAAPVFLALRCGCGTWFEANVSTVPMIRGLPVCRGCWDRLNGLRRRAYDMGLARGMGPWARPACYPEDYPGGG